MPPSLGSPRPRVRQGAPGEPAGEGDATAKLAWAAPPTLDGGPIQIQPGLPWAAPEAASPLALALATRESRVKEPGPLAVWGMGVEVRVKVKGSRRPFTVLPAAPGVLRPGQDLPPPPPNSSSILGLANPKGGHSGLSPPGSQATWMGAEDVPGQLRPLALGRVPRLHLIPSREPQG